MKQRLKKIGIYFSLAFFLFLITKDFTVIEAEANSGYNWREITVYSEEVKSRPGVYWYQIDDGRFRAETEYGLVHSSMKGTNTKPYPNNQYVKEDFDLRKLGIPNSFKDPATRNVYSQSQVYDIEIDKIRFNPDYDGLNSIYKTFEGVAITKKNKTVITATTRTGVSFNSFLYERTGVRNGTNYPKMHVAYYTPIIYTWKAKVRVYDSGLDLQANKGKACIGETIRVTPTLTKNDGSKHQVGSHPNFSFRIPVGDASAIRNGNNINVTGKKAGKIGFIGTFKDASQGIDITESITLEFEDCDDPTIPPPSGECNVPTIIGGDLRYDYELDLLVTKIESETVDKNKSTTTPVTVHRKDFSKNREQVKKEINGDINREREKISRLQGELATLKSQLSNLKSQLATAEKGYLVTKCSSYTDGDGNKQQDCRQEREYDYALINSLKSQIVSKENEIKQKECDIEEAEAKIRGYEKELDDLKKLEDKYKSVTTEVVLTFNGTQKGVKTVTMKEGDTFTLNYEWVLPSDGSVKAEINPKHNLGIEEVTYSNNALQSPIYVASNKIGACVPVGKVSKESGIVRVIVTETDTIVLREYVEGRVVRVSRDSMRAGYGFTYEFDIRYQNEDPKSNAYGVKYAESYFKEDNKSEVLPNYLPYQKGAYGNEQNVRGYVVDMETTYDYATTPARTHNQIWQLPEVKVEEKSGNVFEKDYKRNPFHNPNEKMLEGGRKWYTPWMIKDGIYDYKVMGYEAGVNKLGVCVDGEYEIFGTFIGDPDGNDDFVRRTFSPNNPFPSGIGWNWKGNVNMLTNLQSWWNNPPDREPETAPSSFDECYILDKEAIKQVKAYNERYGIEQDSFLPNGGRFWNEVGPYIRKCPRN